MRPIPPRKTILPAHRHTLWVPVVLAIAPGLFCLGLFALIRA
jgi:hypothetical protein